MVLREGTRPTPGESIFDSDQPGQLNSCVDWARGDWLGFAYGYRQVATRAWLHLEQSPHYADPEIFAFAFLWRHYLELMLKALVQVCEIDAGERVLERHGLVPLWDAIRPTLEAQHWWSSSRADMELIEQVVKDFHRLDEGSYDFRYPADKRGTQTTLQLAPERINAARLNQWMVWVADALEATFDAITGGEGEVRVVDRDHPRGARHTKVRQAGSDEDGT